MERVPYNIYNPYCTFCFKFLIDGIKFYLLSYQFESEGYDPAENKTIISLILPINQDMIGRGWTNDCVLNVIFDSSSSMEEITTYFLQLDMMLKSVKKNIHNMEGKYIINDEKYIPLVIGTSGEYIENDEDDIEN